MKAGIISRSTLIKHGRWDPKYYLSDQDEVDALERAKIRLEQATTTYWRRVRELGAKRAHLGRVRKEIKFIQS